MGYPRSQDMVQLFSGTLDQYFRHAREENALELGEQEQHERTEWDPELQCGHGVSLYRPCKLPGCRESDCALGD